MQRVYPGDVHYGNKLLFYIFLPLLEYGIYRMQVQTKRIGVIKIVIIGVARIDEENRQEGAELVQITAGPGWIGQVCHRLVYFTRAWTTWERVGFT